MVILISIVFSCSYGSKDVLRRPYSRIELLIVNKKREKEKAGSLKPCQPVQTT